MKLKASDIRRSVHPKEWSRFLLALLVAVPATLGLVGLAWATSGLAFGGYLLIAFLVWFGFEVSYATFVANWIVVSQDNYPKVHELLEEMKARIGVHKRIDAIVYEQGQFNAYFGILFARRAVFLNSELLQDGVTDDELRWLLGRFVGQIRAKQRLRPLEHLVALAERLLVFNLLIFPYVRSTAHTGDRIALAAIDGNITAAIAAMNKLIVGRELGYSVNPSGLVKQYRRIRSSFFGFLVRIASPLPHNIARYTQLIGFAERRFPDQHEQFVNMNPSFQIAGGTYPLMRTAPAWVRGEGGNVFIGVGLLTASVVGMLGGSVALQEVGPFFGLDNPFAPRPSHLSMDPAFDDLDDFPEGLPSEPERDEIDRLLRELREVQPPNLPAPVALAAERAREAAEIADGRASAARVNALRAAASGPRHPASGVGWLEWPAPHDGDRYEGEFASSMLHGLGVYTFNINANNPDGPSRRLRYEGEWSYDAMSGHGVFTWAGGMRYRGQFLLGSENGFGVFEDQLGYRYEGERVNGEPHGLGAFYDPQGTLLQAGRWSNGVFQGSSR